MRQTGRFWNHFVFVIFCCFTNSAILFADPDAHVMNRIFGNEHIGANIDLIRQRAAELEPRQRYQYLANWVLPSENHDDIRMTACFAPYVSKPGSRYVDLPGSLTSPASDLVLLGDSLGELDALYQSVSKLKVQGEYQARCRLALLGMIQIQRGEVDEAELVINEFESRRIEKIPSNLHECWPETLLLSFACKNSMLQELAGEYALRILDQQVRVAANSIGDLEWDRYINALWGRSRLNHSNDSLLRLQNWHPVSECDEKTRAAGFPKALWQQFGRQVESLVRHQNEYLFYRIPLQGNYQVECDITGFGYKEGQLVIGGNWISPHHHHESFEFGTLRGVSRNPVAVNPKLSLVNEWIRYRAVIRDGVCRIFLNGRELVSEPLHDHQFPWLAVRSMFFSNAKIRDLRITGSPHVPQFIEMTSDPGLSGWVRFHLDSVGTSTADWHYDESLGLQGGLFARQKDEFAGVFQESLLRYFRPMIEDGIIEYEFDYQPEETLVSPALDQQAFILAPDGVRIHWITNGVWDRTGLDPLNIEPTGQPKVPLKSGWNRLRFEIEGDLMKISVNGSLVYSGAIPKNNDRTFGLFHYADQTSVRVRNMTWTGAWPLTLPELEQQELYGTQLDELNARSAELPFQFHFDFSKPADGNPNAEQLVFQNRLFFLNNADSDGKVTKTEKGLMMMRPPTGPFKDIWLSPNLRLQGDFDIVVEFENLQLGEPTNGTASLYLIAVTQDELTTHSRVWHGVYAHPGIERRRVTQVEFDYFRPGQNVELHFEGVTAEATSSGRMRIMRIGKTYSFMIAEADSLNYRLIHQQEVNDEATAVNGIRIGMGAYDETPPQRGLSVLWENLHVRAEGIVEAR